MKLSCETAQLKSALNSLIGAVDKRTTMPVMKNFRMKAEDGRLHITAANSEYCLGTSIEASVESAGETAIIAHFFQGFIGSLSEERVTIDAESEEARAVITYGNSEAHIAHESAEAFPIVAEADDYVVLMDGAELKSAIDKVVFSASKDNGKPILMGVQMEVMEDEVTFTSADGFRMSVYTAQREPGTSSLANGKVSRDFVMIPATTLAETARLFRDTPQEVRIGLNEDRTKVAFGSDSRKVVGNLINGTPPNFASLMPTSHKTSMKIGVAEILSAASVIATLTDGESPVLRMALSNETDEENPDSLVMSTRNEEIGDNTAGLSPAVEGDENKIAFNNRYIVDMLRAMDRESTVTLEMTDHQKPALFTEEPKEGQPAYKHLLMPMALPRWD